MTPHWQNQCGVFILNMKFSIKVHPKSKKIEVREIDSTHFEIWVREAPDKGRANEAVILALSGHLKVPRIKLSIVSGHQSKNKILLLN